ncbi:5-(carboxyamino)imidazole ribonucleotide mutase [Rubrivirga sp. S365]|uniref:N5-carboxyaminoimidazole ribonucleotide mutase n=1 Tax=Rubrivirga litoralis TaxID=3075598 RepID=A0ABU3BMW7_9BACT|nr:MULTISPECIES: 5-(carboxyamino)imidazole ribonucleotide mutase [unclassified Rubrivirga]MDT0630623.1 5-(carboxyamino)imidazole ribonucleotide mutase [Rubrivirga sp. F394]MDT7857664.1 5-(carboxyamino)imidazole ribonucleotide mutase [Rubrivirga sp. S365]
MPTPLVGLAMGSESDWPTMDAAADVLADFGVPFEARVLSAHRTPDAMTDYARTAAERGLRVIVAGAGGAAHLPGMIAASTVLPVVGVPVATRNLKGMDSLLSIVQMPGGVPVATVAIGQAQNAALLAVQILATSDDGLRAKLEAHRQDLRDRVAEMDANVADKARRPAPPEGA